MPICSYLAIPEKDAAPRLAERLAAIPGCDVVRARNRDLLLVVTDTSGPEEDQALRTTLEGLEELQALIFTFGDIDPDTEEADPLARGRPGQRADRKR